MRPASFKEELSAYRNARQTCMQLSKRSDVWCECDAIGITQVAEGIRCEQAERRVGECGDNVGDRIHERRHRW